MCETPFHMNPRKTKEKKQSSQIKRPFTFLQLKFMKSLKRRNGGSFKLEALD